MNTATSRTSDIVPSLPILVTQLYSLCQLCEGQETEGKDFNLSAVDLKKFSRFIAEEQDRRLLKREPMSRHEIL